MSKIDQKEYLKKYLSGDKKKKKKKKVSSTDKARVKIIDDDIDVVKNTVDYDEELILTGEDAPQVVGIIDDRPPELKAIEDYRNSGKWKTLSASDIKTDGDNKTKEKSPTSKTNNTKVSDDDYSPPRKPKNTNNPFKGNEETKASLSKNNIRTDSDGDYSPPRKSWKYTSSSHVKSKKDDDDDLSPPRRPKNSSSGYYSQDNRSRIKSDDDLSPPRKARCDSSGKYSPPKRKRDDKVRDYKASRWNKYDKPSPKRSSRRSRSSDYSPPRRQRGSDDDRSNRSKGPKSSQEKNTRNGTSRRSVELSPRRSRERSRRKITPPRKVDDKDDLSPSKKTNSDNRERKRDSKEREKTKPHQTLDGKKAGLQGAKLLKEETEKFRKKEDDMFQKMSAEVSGKDADIVVRNRRVKSAAELQKEEEKERESNKRNKEKQDAYNRWGMGLKQIEDYKTKIAEEMHEISKPLARYSNDADLDEMLKKQERQGDPMLQYIREKNQEKNKTSNAQIIPIYKGPFPENRFNIRPGYRWDGIDRSTGYEKKWFEMQNQKKAIQEEAYKYSVEDM